MAAPTAVPVAAADVVLIRHGETEWNRLGLLNGDPRVSVPLTAAGRAACSLLAPLFAPVAWASVFVTRFARTRESLALMLPEGPEPAVLADLGDIDLGALEGHPRSEYRAWRLTHDVGDAPAGGESRLAVLARYGRGLGWLAAQAGHPALVVTHDQPIRYLENALADADPFFGPAAPIPNATPYAYAADALRRGAAALAERAAAGE